MAADPPDESLGVVAIDEEELEGVHDNGNKLNLIERKKNKHGDYVVDHQSWVSQENLFWNITHVVIRTDPGLRATEATQSISFSGRRSDGRGRLLAIDRCHDINNKQSNSNPFCLPSGKR